MVQEGCPLARRFRWLTRNGLLAAHPDVTLVSDVTCFLGDAGMSGVSPSEHHGLGTASASPSAESAPCLAKLLDLSNGSGAPQDIDVFENDSSQENTEHHDIGALLQVWGEKMAHFDEKLAQLEVRLASHDTMLHKASLQQSLGTESSCRTFSSNVSDEHKKAEKVAFGQEVAVSDEFCTGHFTTKQAGATLELAEGQIRCLSQALSEAFEHVGFFRNQIHRI